MDDNMAVGVITPNTPIWTASEITETINDAKGNEAAAGREKPSLVVTAGDQSRTLGKLEDKEKPRPTDPPPSEVKPGREFLDENGVANLA